MLSVRQFTQMMEFFEKNTLRFLLMMQKISHFEKKIARLDYETVRYILRGGNYFSLSARLLVACQHTSDPTTTMLTPSQKVVLSSAPIQMLAKRHESTGVK